MIDEETSELIQMLEENQTVTSSPPLLDFDSRTRAGSNYWPNNPIKEHKQWTGDKRRVQEFDGPWWLEEFILGA